MGMFDYIVCHYPLPGLPGFVKPGHQFQTKDTEPQYMETHTIEEDGTFSIAGFTGEIDFGTSNWAGFHGRVVYTRDGEDYESVEYHAVFVAGKMVSVTRTEYERSPAWPSGRKEPGTERAPWTEEDKRNFEEEKNLPRVGKAIHIKYGTGEWFSGEVVAESNREVVCRVSQSDDPYHKVGGLHTISRGFYNHLWADDKSVIDDQRRSKEDKHAKRLAEWDAFVASRIPTPPQPAKGEEEKA